MAQYVRIRVYDPILRSLHAWNGLSILGLIATGQLALHMHLDDARFDPATVGMLHVWLGYALVLGLAGRIAWAFAGPPAARWQALWHPQAWATALRKRRFYAPHPGGGHHPLASAAYLGLYAILLGMAASGLALAAIDLNTGPLYPWLGHDAWRKPWFQFPHEALHYLVIAFLLLHIAALIQHERREGVPLAQAMISGYQYLRPSEKDAL